MANIIKNNNSEPKQSRSKKTAAIIALIVAVLCVIVYIATHLFAVLFIGFLSLVICFVLFASCPVNSVFTTENKHFGNRGEKMAGSFLKQNLPDSYSILQNKTVTYDNATSEIDNIIVGKTGVFILEIKNMKGKITGEYEDKEWKKIKIDDYDIEHEETFYNPTKQVGTQIFRLAKYLRDNKIFTHINGAVFFVNSESKLRINGTPKDIPIFTYNTADELLDFITGSKEALSNKEIERIIGILSELN